jgi:hypothetical protein
MPMLHRSPSLPHSLTHSIPHSLTPPPSCPLSLPLHLYHAPALAHAHRYMKWLGNSTTSGTRALATNSPSIFSRPSDMWTQVGTKLN